MYLIVKQSISPLSKALMVFVRLTPGLSYILNTLPGPILVAATVHSFRTFIFTNTRITSLAWNLIYILAFPAIRLFQYIITRFLEHLEMRRLRARNVPAVHSQLPFGISILRDSVRTFLHGQLGGSFCSWHTQYGPTYGFRILGEYNIFTCEPEYIKSMLATDFENFGKGQHLKAILDTMLGNGVFNSDGEVWKFHRSITRPFFARDRVTDFDIFERHNKVVIDKLIERFAEDEAIDFQDLMSRLTLDCATEFCFGSCIHSLAAPLPYAYNTFKDQRKAKSHPSDQFSTAIADAQVKSTLRTRFGGIWPLAEILKDNLAVPMAVIYDYMNPIFQEALKKKSSKIHHVKNDEPATLLDHLVQETDDISIIREEVINIMIAGRDTTMSMLTFIIYALSQNPRVLKTLRQEILTMIGPTRRPNYDDIRKCKYLRAVINETLRLYPPVPLNIRTSIKSMTWPAKDGGKPYYIPKECPFLYSVFVMHRRMDLWGPDALEYDPNRFLDERVHKYLTPNPYIFLPFNTGPRICLGQQFAYNEASYVLVRLLQTFDTITLDSNAQPPDSRPPPDWRETPEIYKDEKIWMKAHLTLYAYKGLWVRMARVAS